MGDAGLRESETISVSCVDAPQLAERVVVAVPVLRHEGESFLAEDEAHDVPVELCLDSRLRRVRNLPQPLKATRVMRVDADEEGRSPPIGQVHGDVEAGIDSVFGRERKPPPNPKISPSLIETAISTCNRDRNP